MGHYSYHSDYVASCHVSRLAKNIQNIKFNITRFIFHLIWKATHLMQAHVENRQTIETLISLAK